MGIWGRSVAPNGIQTQSSLVSGRTASKAPIIIIYYAIRQPRHTTYYTLLQNTCEKKEEKKQ